MIGKQIGHYKVLSKIGEGGMGQVYLAEDTRLERKAAIKFLPASTAADDEIRTRFLREAKAASALNHPHVCVVYDVGETEDGLPYIAMEYIEGDSLNAVAKSEPLDVPAIVEISIQVADALDAAHKQRIVHRDIKLANICRNERGQIKVLDFGLAKQLADEGPDALGVTSDMQQTRAGQVLGTPTYMSPEQALGKAVDHRTDLFSLGVVMYRLVTGSLPFGGSNFAEIVNNIVNAQPPAIARLNYNAPAELERITLKCLQKQPERRYQSAAELMVDLQNLARQLEFGGEAGGGGMEATQSFMSVDGPTPSAAKQPIKIDDVKSSDVLLSYASIDDQPLLSGTQGWVSQLHRNLEVRMEQLSGEKVSVARLSEDAITPAVEGELLEQLPQAKAMISVVSPPFIKSELCRREVQQFWEGAEQTGGQWIDDKARLMKVLKTAVSNDDYPPELADILSPLFGFEFYETDAQSGRIREFDETFGPTLKQRFFERVYDLAYDACQILRRFQQVRAQQNESSTANPNRRWVYLATTTTDVQDERDRIKRELLERGHVVLPDAPLPMISGEVKESVAGCLEKCSMAIHLLGRHYGVTPEDSSESIPALQVRLTAEWARDHDLQRLVWLPGECQPDDTRQLEFLRRVHEDPILHHGAEVIEGNLNILKKDLIRRLEPAEEKKEQIMISRSDGPPKLYLICDPRDESAIEALEDHLFNQGLEVSLPAFDGDDADAAALHQENLLSCDAVLIYYGAAPKAWVDIKLRELLKAAGYGREKPIDLQAVYIAPPDDRRKERFKSHQASVLRQGETFAPTPELHSFVSQIMEVGS